jgi:hypothetical protein
MWLHVDKTPLVTAVMAEIKGISGKCRRAWNRYNIGMVFRVKHSLLNEPLTANVTGCS